MLTFFGSCIIHILNTGCATILKGNSGAKGLIICISWRITNRSVAETPPRSVSLCCAYRYHKWTARQGTGGVLCDAFAPSACVSKNSVAKYEIGLKVKDYLPNL